jgi:hypothetical protein
VVSAPGGPIRHFEPNTPFDSRVDSIGLVYDLDIAPGVVDRLILRVKRELKLHLSSSVVVVSVLMQEAAFASSAEDLESPGDPTQARDGDR